MEWLKNTVMNLSATRQPAVSSYLPTDNIPQQLTHSSLPSMHSIDDSNGVFTSVIAIVLGGGVEVTSDFMPQVL